MFGLSTGFIKYIAIALIVAMTMGALWYISELKADIAIHKANTDVLKEQIQVQQSTITTVKKEFELTRLANSRLQSVIDSQKQDLRKLNEKFKVTAKGTTRDIGSIATVKPVLVERLVNRGTQNSIRCTEIAMGSPMLKGEKNNECQDLIDSINNSILP